MSLLSGQFQFDNYKYLNTLPLPEVIDTSQRKSVTLQIQQVDQFLGLYDTTGVVLNTSVWGYGSGKKASYPGPTLLVYEDIPISVTWLNKLPATGHLLPVDTTVHLAQSVKRPMSEGFIPIVTHLHGGHTESASDGLPEQWYTQSRGGPGVSGPRDVGPDFKSSTANYANDQQAATLWYHDHALGITRLNVYAGLAGFYILEDPQRLTLEKSGVLPGGSFDIGMAIQDRAFTSTGQLYYPAYKADELPGQFNEDGSPMTVDDMVPEAFYAEHGDSAPSAVPEFFGDTILVNGMAWPKLKVAAGDYGFRLLNGSDSRFYVLELDNPNVGVTLVGTDGGLLPTARTIMDGDGTQESHEFIVLAPGDRVELVFDFSKLATGEKVHLLNLGPDFAPFKGISDDGTLLGDATAADASLGIGNIMEFTVDRKLKAFDATVKDGTVLNASHVDLTADSNQDGAADVATTVRKLGLFEGADEYGRVMPMLGTAEAGALHTSMEAPDGAFGPLMYDAPVTEKPLLNTTEDWMIFNFTADSHPIHLHLTQFQVVEKREIAFQDEDDNGVPDDTNGDGQITYGKDATGAIDYASADIWIGELVALRPEEAGWQDTVQVSPNEMISILAEFDLAGEYVWHCHILSHEDNEMMRPFTVEEPALFG